MPSAIDAKALAESVQAQLPAHFQDAQHSLANHRKNVVSLYRLHTQCAQLTEQTPRGTRLLGEKAFNECFFVCLNRVLALKKGVSNADRICKFISAYAAYAKEQFECAAAKAAANTEDTPATRFVTIMLKHLLKGFRAKDKNVRLRCCSCVALLVNVVDSIDDELFQTLSGFLLERLGDREASVRVQAAVAIARLQLSDEEDDASTTRLLLHLLRHDPSAEVRRAALFNITPSQATLPYIIERLQDVDATNRRCVYVGSLKLLLQLQPTTELDGVTIASGLGLSETAAAEVVRIGLHEREASVQKAARKLMLRWLDAFGGDMVRLLDQLHVAHHESGEPVVMALLEEDAALVDRTAALLGDQQVFWAETTPSKALLAKCFVLFCKHANDDARLDACLPPVTALVFRIEAEYVQLCALLEQQAAEEMEEDMPAIQDHRSLSRIVVVREMLAVAMHCDYGDEMGRRKMFMLVREMLGNAWLPAVLIPFCLDVLLQLSSGQRDFVQMVVELVQALDAETEEDIDPDLSARAPLSWQARLDADADPASAAQRAALDARRLLIVRTMLERVVSQLQDNTAFHGLIPQLIVPAVRSKDAVVREEGLVCLGLCSLLDQKMALDTFPLLLDQIQRASGRIRVRCIQSLFDLIVVHGIAALCTRSADVAAQSEFDGDLERGMHFAQQQMVGFLLSLLEHDDADVQTTVAEGTAKLMLTGALAEDDVLKSLVLTYMSPDTVDNAVLRQCLSYFLPLYCSSHARHQRMIQRIFLDTFQVLANVHEEPETQDMVAPAQVALQLADWCNPEKLMLSDPDEDVHVDLAIELLHILFTLRHKEQRKALVQVLNKLYLPPSLDAVRAKTLGILVHELRQYFVHEDATVRSALARFDSSVDKRYAAQCSPWAPALARADGTLASDAFAALDAFFTQLPPPPAAPRQGRTRKNARKDTSEEEESLDESHDYSHDEVAL